MNEILRHLSLKKQQLDTFRPLPPELVRNLDDWFRVELTYTSNAIEGNTLTRNETALVVEKGLTVDGKSIVEHLEATNHAHALGFVHQLAQRTRQQLTEDDLLEIHRLILRQIDDPNAGRYRSVPVRIAGTAVVLPNHAKVPDLMTTFMAWLRYDQPDHPARIAAEAHYRLVTIHPFVDGNGRTARLLMNLLLLQSGYPPAIIRPQDRRTYISALEKAQTGGSPDDYYRLMYQAVERSLDLYLDAAAGRSPSEDASAMVPATHPTMLRPGQLAELTGVRLSTIKHYAELGLLPFQQDGPGLSRRYAAEASIQRLQQIQVLQAQGLTLEQVQLQLARGDDGMASAA